MPKATGSNNDACWKMGSGAFEDGLIADALALVIDSAKHGVVGPAAIVSRETYSAALAATRNSWVIDEE